MFYEMLFGGIRIGDFVKELLDLPGDGINPEGEGGPERFPPKA